MAIISTNVISKFILLWNLAFLFLFLFYFDIVLNEKLIFVYL